MNHTFRTDIIFILGTLHEWVARPGSFVLHYLALLDKDSVILRYFEVSDAPTGGFATVFGLCVWFFALVTLAKIYPYCARLMVFRDRKTSQPGDSAAQGNIVSILHRKVRLAEDEVEGSKGKELARPVRWYRLAADQGDAHAQFNLGTMFYNGENVPQDYAEAMKWYRLAAIQGHADAQDRLGMEFFSGRSVPQSYLQAAKWHRLAADQGHAAAQYNIAVMFDHGIGLAQSYKDAVKWYRLAANQGHADAQYNLGGMFYCGRFVAQSHVEAVKWYRMAADKGHARALEKLGWMADHNQAPLKSRTDGVEQLDIAAEGRVARRHP